MRNVHFMGILGSGCSAAAALTKTAGFEISGCDINLDKKLFPKNLQRIPLFSKHDPSHLENVDILVISPAILAFDPQNEEISRAKSRGIKILTWQNFIGTYLQKDKFVIAVAGAHGKSTTTAMIGYVLEKAGLDPSVLLGARVLAWGRNFRVGKSKYFIIEADEFNNNFFNYKPDVAVILTIDFDHPEFFKDINAILASFDKFIRGSGKKTIVIANAKDAGIQKLLVKLQRKVFQISSFTKPESLRLKIPGEYNLFNATAAYLTGVLLGLEKRKIKLALSKFSGIERRTEFKGEKNGMKIFDDYAHHPREIEATTKALREIYSKKKIALVFQPHLYTRTKVLFDDFVSTFQNIPADYIFLVDIFGAREKRGDVSSRDLVEATKSKKVQYIGSLENAYRFLKDKEFDVLVNMGAGNIFELTQKLLK